MAGPICTPENPYTVACFPRAVNPQATDLVSGMQAQGPNKPNETVGFTLAQVAAFAGAGNFLPLSGGNLTGPLTLSGNATTALQAVPLQQLSMVSVLDHGAVGNGSADDTAAIQNVLNTYAGKATVYFPWSGNHYRVSTLNLPSNTDILLTGVIRALPGLTQSMVLALGANNISIRGTGVLDGFASGQTNTIGTVETVNANNMRISGITIQNAKFWNLNISQSDDVVVDGVTLIGGGSANGFAIGCTNCWFVNSKIDGTGNGDYGFAFYGTVSNCGAIGNVVMNCGAGTSAAPPGIGVLSDGTAPAPQAGPCSNIIITNNIVHGCGAGGISSLCVSSPATTHSSILIHGNRCYNNNRITGSAAVADIFVDQTVGVSIKNNQLSSNGTASVTGVAGVFLGPNVKSASVVANEIFNVGQGSTNGAGIWINGANYIQVSGNYVYDNQVTPTMGGALVGTAGTQNIITDNFFGRAAAIGAQSDTVLANYFSTGPTITNGRLNVVAQIGALNTSSVPRWYFGNAGNTESGGNTGSDFTIVSVNDAGSGLLGAPITVTRSTGTVSFNPYFASDLNVILNGAAGFNRLIGYTTANTARWFVGANATAESGANAGSDYVIVSCADNASILQTPLKITRASGAVSLSGALGINGSSPPAKPTVTGSKGANAALASLITALASYGLITDSTT